MTTPLDDVCRACLPVAALPGLAELRCRPGVSVHVAGDRAWVRWSAGDERVLRCLLPLPGVELYVCRDGLWYRPGAHLLVSDAPPADAGKPLEHVLFPAPVGPEPPPARAGQPVLLRLVRDGRPRPATAVWCAVAELADWAEAATSAQLARLRGTRCGDRLIVLGRPLPALPRARRFWGERLLVPLGFRPEPALPEGALLEALTSGGDEVVLLTEKGAEVVPCEAFGPLTRAGVRLAREH